MKSVTDQLIEELGRDVRTARYRLKQANKQLGKAGATIFALRNENASLRTGTCVNIGDYARLLRQLRESQAETDRLREKLAAKEEKA